MSPDTALTGLIVMTWLLVVSAVAVAIVYPAFLIVREWWRRR